MCRALSSPLLLTTGCRCAASPRLDSITPRQTARCVPCCDVNCSFGARPQITWWRDSFEFCVKQFLQPAKNSGLPGFLKVGSSTSYRFSRKWVLNGCAQAKGTWNEHQEVSHFGQSDALVSLVYWSSASRWQWLLYPFSLHHLCCPAVPCCTNLSILQFCRWLACLFPQFLGVPTSTMADLN